MILSYVFLLLQIFFVIFFFYLLLAWVVGAPFVPTTNAASESMIRLAHIQKGTRVYDLGSGNGKLLFLAAAAGGRGRGYEINPMLVLFTNIKAVLMRAQVRASWKNFWHADIHDADVICIYLLPWKMDVLAAKIKRECKKGTIVVSNSFIFPNWKILREDASQHIYVFRV